MLFCLAQLIQAVERMEELPVQEKKFKHRGSFVLSYDFNEKNKVKVNIIGMSILSKCTHFMDILAKRNVASAL